MTKTEKYTNNDHQIQDATLAENMAYGEKPYRKSSTSELPEDAQKAVLKLGHKAGMAAGLEHIQAKGEVDPARVEAVKTALAERYGYSPEDFTLLEYEDFDGKDCKVVALATDQAIDLADDPAEEHDDKRSYISIMSDDDGNKEAHTIEIEGIEYDDRMGMTFASYIALLEKGIKVDSQERVLMTGEPLMTPIAGVRKSRFPRARSAILKEGKDFYSIFGDTDQYATGKGIVFRPAVVLHKSDLSKYY